MRDTLESSKSRRQGDEGGVTLERSTWLDREIEKSEFKDMRLKERFRTLVEDLWQGIGETIPFANQDWKNTKAAYRFFLMIG